MKALKAALDEKETDKNTNDLTAVGYGENFTGDSKTRDKAYFLERKASML